MKKLLSSLAIAGLLAVVNPLAPTTAFAEVKTSPVFGLWCSGGGTFVIEGGVFRYYQRGRLKFETTYRVSGGKLIKRKGPAYTFYKRGGRTFYQRGNKKERILVQHKCRYSRSQLQ